MRWKAQQVLWPTLLPSFYTTIFQLHSASSAYFGPSTLNRWRADLAASPGGGGKCSSEICSDPAWLIQTIPDTRWAGSCAWAAPFRSPFRDLQGTACSCAGQLPWAVQVAHGVWTGINSRPPYRHLCEDSASATCLNCATTALTLFSYCSSVSCNPRNI